MTGGVPRFWFGSNASIALGSRCRVFALTVTPAKSCKTKRVILTGITAGTPMSVPIFLNVLVCK